GMRARRTRRDVSEARPFQAELHRDLRGRGIRHEHRYEEGRHPRWTLLLHDEHFSDEGLEAADAGRDGRTDTLRVLHRVEAGILERLRRRADGEMREAIRASDLFPIHVLRRLVSADLARDLRLVRGRVEARDATDPAPAMHEGVPVARDVEPERRDQSHTGHDDATRPGETACGLG